MNIFRYVKKPIAHACGYFLLFTITAAFVISVLIVIGELVSLVVPYPDFLKGRGILSSYCWGTVTVVLLTPIVQAVRVFMKYVWPYIRRWLIRSF